APKLVKTTAAGALSRRAPESAILIPPVASVPGPVQIAPPHPPVLSRMFVGEATSTHTVVFREIASWRPRLIDVASSRAAAWSAADLAYRTSVGVTSVARAPTIVTTISTSGNANPRAVIRRIRPSTSRTLAPPRTEPSPHPRQGTGQTG